MAFHIRTLLVGASLLVAPGLAMAQQAPAAPTADSAAAQVGQSPKAALDENGKRVEPSEKLWTNPRTKAEQPGTQPPPNTSAVESGTQQHTGKHGHKKHHAGKTTAGTDGQQSVTSPLTGAKSD